MFFALSAAQRVFGDKFESFVKDLLDTCFFITYLCSYFRVGSLDALPTLCLELYLETIIFQYYDVRFTLLVDEYIYIYV